MQSRNKKTNNGAIEEENGWEGNKGNQTGTRCKPLDGAKPNEDKSLFFYSLPINTPSQHQQYQTRNNKRINSVPAVPPPAGDAVRPPRHERVPNGGRFSALRVLQRWLQKLLLHVHLRHGGQQVASKHNYIHSRM